MPLHGRATSRNENIASFGRFSGVCSNAVGRKVHARAGAGRVVVRAKFASNRSALSPLRFELESIFTVQARSIDAVTMLFDTEATASIERFGLQNPNRRISTLNFTGGAVWRK